MKHSRMNDLRDHLQKIMLRNGARLSSLDNLQKWSRTRNNNIEGEHTSSSTSTSVGDIIMLDQFGKEVVEASTPTAPATANNTNVVTPAGGKTDAEVVRKVLDALSRPGAQINVNNYVPYTRTFLEAAIPTAVYTTGLVATVAALVFIDNKWGMGARQDRLISAGLLDVKALGNGGMSMDLDPSKS